MPAPISKPNKKMKKTVSDKIPLSCKISAELDSNSNAIVKSSIAWDIRKQLSMSRYELLFVQENHMQSKVTQVRHHESLKISYFNHFFSMNI